MTEVNAYRATQSIARSLLSCGVRLSVCLSRWWIETAKLTIKLFHRLVAPSFQFSKGDPTVKFRRRGHPQQGRQIEVGYQKFAILNQYFRNTDTDTEYRGISKYRYRIRTDMKKIPTKILNTDTDSKYRYRPSSVHAADFHLSQIFLECSSPGISIACPLLLVACASFK